ncbi:MAG: hypothetical protein KDA79_08735 [Planctomycetaceae bacterium]|nr:hypothetical protein [Planctomycetaceae bacterium]
MRLHTTFRILLRRLWSAGTACVVLTGFLSQVSPAEDVLVPEAAVESAPAEEQSAETSEPECGLLAGTHFDTEEDGSCEPYRVPLQHDEPIHIVARIDALFLSRASGPDETLAEDGGGAGATDAFNANELEHSTVGSPRFALTATRGRHSVEFQYFSVDGMRARDTNRLGDELLIDSVIATLKAGPTTFEYETQLQNAELNYRFAIHDRVQLLTGFRWMDLDEDFETTITSGFVPVPVASRSIQALNRLSGGQIGTDLLLVDSRRFRLTLGGRFGLLRNDAKASFVYDDSGILSAADSRELTSMLYQLELVGRVRLNDYVTLVTGFQSMWLSSIATAPSQISRTDVQAGTMTLADDNISFFGSYFGLELDLY